MAVTVKKRALGSMTAKTIVSEASADATVPSVMPAMAPVPHAKAPSYVVYGILGLLAVLMFGVLLFIQYVEFNEYSQPGVFAVFVAQPGAATPSEAPAEGSAEEQPADEEAPPTE